MSLGIDSEVVVDANLNYQKYPQPYKITFASNTARLNLQTLKSVA